VTLAAWLPSLLLAPFLAFFFLRDGCRFTKFIANAVPNAFFERTLYLMHEMDKTARAYFQGLISLTILDTIALAVGLWVIGLSAPLLLGLVCAVLAWVPYIGSILGCLLVVLVAATDFPLDPWMAYGAIIVFILVRLLDDFVFMPLTIGRSLRMHPLLTVLMIFVGGAVAGVAGLMLVLPLLGVAMVVGETVGDDRHRPAPAGALCPCPTPQGCSRPPPTFRPDAAGQRLPPGNQSAALASRATRATPPPWRPPCVRTRSTMARPRPAPDRAAARRLEAGEGLLEALGFLGRECPARGPALPARPDRLHGAWLPRPGGRAAVAQGVVDQVGGEAQQGQRAQHERRQFGQPQFNAAPRRCRGTAMWAMTH
jgi:hypothetical protein